jgi:hypothetical protein
LSTNFEATLFAVERLDRVPPLFAVVRMSGSADHDLVPFSEIRSVCTNLDLSPDIFENPH